WGYANRMIDVALSMLDTDHKISQESP
ncbi:MAG: hypothetical protein ACI9EP_000679, partial [Oceanospirillaceae bacterium]